MTTLHYPEHSKQFEQAVQALKGKKVAVLGHVRPDGDCIGSQVALARVLISQGIDAVCYNHHAVPAACQSFVGDTPFFVDSVGIDEDRLAVTVDCADRKRLGPVANERFDSVFLNVDHHISNTTYAETNIIEGTASATGELLAGILLDNGYEIDAITAQALYIGIATDTGQFRFASTTMQTFEICCELMKRGADPASAAMELYEKESPAKLALLQRFLSTFEYHCDNRVCIGTIDKQAWAETGATKEDTEGLVDYARSIDGIEIGILLEEREGILKGSFRAKDPVHRVDLLAKNFNGGGHACAAGFNPEMPLVDFYPKLKETLIAHFNKIDKEKDS